MRKDFVLRNLVLNGSYKSIQFLGAIGENEAKGNEITTSKRYIIVPDVHISYHTQESKILQKCTMGAL